MLVTPVIRSGAVTGPSQRGSRAFPRRMPQDGRLRIGISHRAGAPGHETAPHSRDSSLVRARGPSLPRVARFSLWPRRTLSSEVLPKRSGIRMWGAWPIPSQRVRRAGAEQPSRGSAPHGRRLAAASRRSSDPPRTPDRTAMRAVAVCVGGRRAAASPWATRSAKPRACRFGSAIVWPASRSSSSSSWSWPSDPVSARRAWARSRRGTRSARAAARHRRERARRIGDRKLGAPERGRSLEQQPPHPLTGCCQAKRSSGAQPQEWPTAAKRSIPSSPATSTSWRRRVP